MTYEKDNDAVRQAVDQASTVLLYVHGIIGDTVGMARSAVLSGSAPALRGSYDVILTFDYENVNTPIEENADLLRQRLAGVGLDGYHDKQLDIVAHSMGGLVSRYLSSSSRAPGEPAGHPGHPQRGGRRGRRSRSGPPQRSRSPSTR